ncbi:hypothetical protein BK704_17840 [[Bacillus thuringiensis] serovar konkukian]|nr:hypothetical protein BK704_17840 [[Bacillus thuringiensis] serovar konkukian]
MRGAAFWWSFFVGGGGGNNIWPFPRTKKSKQLHQSYFGSYEELHHLFLQVSKFYNCCTVSP